MASFMLTRPKRIRHHMNAMRPDPPLAVAPLI